MGLTTEEVLHRLLDLRHAGHAANQDDLVDLARLQAGILQRRGTRIDRALDQILDQCFQLRPGQLDVEMLRPRRVRRDERQVDLGLGRCGQLDLGLLGRLLEALQRELVFAQIDALLFLKLVGEILHDPGVEIFAAEECVTVGRLDLEDAIANFENGNIERAAAKVIDRDRARLFLLEAIGQCRRRRLVDDAQHFEAGDLARVLGGLAL